MTTDTLQPGDVPPESLPTVSFVTWRDRAILVLTVLIAADIWLTVMGLGMGAVETNPGTSRLLASHGLWGWLFARTAAYTLAVGVTLLLTARQGAVWMIALCGMHAYPVVVNGLQLVAYYLVTLPYPKLLVL